MLVRAAGYLQLDGGAGAAGGYPAGAQALERHLGLAGDAPEGA